MTVLSLFGWIVLAIALQAAIFLGIGFSRHWRRYRQLEHAAPNVASAATTPDVEFEQPSTSAWRGTRRFRVERREIESEDGAICSFHLVPEDGQALAPFKPGQFLTFELAMPEGDRLVRCYSLSDAPRADRYRVSIKRVPPARQELPPGRSSNHFHDHVAVGTVLDVRAPGGHFHLEAGSGPVVLIAGGIGITPLMAMLEWSLEHEADREVWLFYGVRHGRELALRERLESQASRHANFHLRYCFSDPLPHEMAGRDFHHHGRVGIDLLRLQLPLKPYHFYICGPGPMMASMVEGLEGWGVPDERIHFEAFGPASVKRRQVQPAAAPESAPDVQVTFARSGRQVPWRRSAGSLLEFAEQEGIAVDSSCRGGACGTCRTTISAGEVSYFQTPDYDPEPGTCLLCVCTPKTSVTLEA